jgi:hypothetical protein
MTADIQSAEVIIRSSPTSARVAGMSHFQNCHKGGRPHPAAFDR